MEFSLPLPSQPCTKYLSGCASVASLGPLISQQALHTPQLIITPSLQEAEELTLSLNLLSHKNHIYTLTGLKLPHPPGIPPKSTWERMFFLRQLQKAKKQEIFICPYPYLLQKTILPENLPTYHLTIGSTVDDQLKRNLKLWGYRSLPLAEDPGSYSDRGHILDIFSSSYRNPLRIELFDDQIEAIHTFDSKTGKNIQSLREATIIPFQENFYGLETTTQIVQRYKELVAPKDKDTQASYEQQDIPKKLSRQQFFPEIPLLTPCFHKKTGSILDYLDPEKIQVWNFYPKKQEQVQEKILNEIQSPPDEEEPLYPNERTLLINNLKLNHLKIISVNNFNNSQDSSIQVYRTEEVSKKFIQNYTNTHTQNRQSLLKSQVRSWLSQSYKIIVFAKNSTLVSEISFLLKNAGFSTQEASSLDQALTQKHISIVEREIGNSFILERERVVLFSHGPNQRRKITSKDKLQNSMKSLSFSSLEEGNLLIHKQYGLGIYRGLQKIVSESINSEFLKLEYKGGDSLYVPIYKMDSVQKYIGPESTLFLNKLGTHQWGEQIQKARKKIRDIATELLKVQAQRTLTDIAPITPGRDYNSFIEQLPYRLTPDQSASIEDVLEDLKKGCPMDRLVCGDVGFGKTEVAIHTLFVLIKAGYQAAFLAPTTVLSYQHGKNLKDRLEKWGIRTAVLNRFTSTKKTQEILNDLSTGKLHLIIGTHKILSPKVKFKNLGLFIIDEEQKFGVQQKQKIKNTRTKLHTLTLTATPIPRSLNMSLLGIRDLSLVQTAPTNRIPIKLFISKYEKESVRKAILHEYERGGQSFIICPKIQDIEAIYERIKNLVPSLNVVWAHGALPETELEAKILEFYEKKIDVLIATSIMESGVDMPTANTIFIYNAQNFGLSQIYQLKGRVGRSNIRSYCYLLTKDKKHMSNQQIEKIKAIESYNQLGQGIMVAQKDLDIRGPGNLLGENQSGFANAIGYEMYIELLEDEIALQKQTSRSEPTTTQVEINIPLPAFIPESYISHLKIRLSYYKMISCAENTGQLSDLEENFKDQFGPLPEELIGLLQLTSLKIKLQNLMAETITCTKTGISIKLNETTSISIEKLIELSQQEDGLIKLQPPNGIFMKIDEPLSWELIQIKVDTLISQVTEKQASQSESN